MAPHPCHEHMQLAAPFAQHLCYCPNSCRLEYTRSPFQQQSRYTSLCRRNLCWHLAIQSSSTCHDRQHNQLSAHIAAQARPNISYFQLLGPTRHQCLMYAKGLHQARRMPARECRCHCFPLPSETQSCNCVRRNHQVVRRNSGCRHRFR